MNPRRIFACLASCAIALALTACESTSDSLLNGTTPTGPTTKAPADPNANADPSPSPPPSTDPNDPNNPDKPKGPTTCLTAQKSYVGFGAVKLEAGRIDEPAGLNRRRVKPYSALAGEYARVLGSTPPLLGSAAATATLGQSPARFGTEPTANASSLFTSYRIAFEGCLTYTGTGATYANAPTAGTAATECAAMTRKFWSRTATSEEIATCASVATTDTAGETPRRRWAYTCAAVLSSADFLTY